MDALPMRSWCRLTSRLSCKTTRRALCSSLCKGRDELACQLQPFVRRHRADLNAPKFDCFHDTLLLSTANHRLSLADRPKLASASFLYALEGNVLGFDEPWRRSDRRKL